MAFRRPLLGLALLLVAGACLRADEPFEVQMKFLQRLREKNHARLAAEYLERLKRHPTPQLEAVLPLELARNKLALARQQDPDRRSPLLEQARGELQRFADQHGNRPDGALARLDLARVLALQAGDRLAVALRHVDTRIRDAGAEAAFKLYLEAGKEFENAVNQLRQHGRAQDALQARFERARCYLDQSRTYLDVRSEKQNTDRSEAVDQGRKIFDELARQAGPPLGDLSRAWLIRCYQKTGNPQLAAKQFKAFQNDHAEKFSPASHCWARYFHVLGIADDPAVKLSPAGKLFLVQRECLAWLNDYPLERDHPVGRAVRFELAEASFRQAQLIAKKTPKSPEVPPLLDNARQWYESLLEPENEYTERAQQQYTAATFLRVGSGGRPPEELVSFDDCFLQGQFEMYRMSQAVEKLTSAAPGERKSLEEERQKHLRQVIRAMRQALSLAGESVPARKAAEAEFYLTSAYLAEGDWHRAAVLGEQLARADPPTRHSAQAAGYALEAYAQVLAHSNSLPDRDRYVRLADFVLRDRAAAWKGDAVTSVAHYHLASVLLREKKYAEAVAEFLRVRRDFPGHLYARCQLALTALEARQRALTDEVQDWVLPDVCTSTVGLLGCPLGQGLFLAASALIPGRTQYRLEETALQALQSIPRLTPGSDPATAQMYFTAQVEQGRILYDRKKYDEMRGFARQLSEQFDHFAGGMEPRAAEGLRYSLSVLSKLATYGVADTFYRAKNYDQTLKTIAEVVGPIEEQGKSGKPVTRKDHQLAGSFLGLAVRAHLQKNDGARARTYLALLRQLRGEDGQASDLAEVLGSLADELQDQVRDLKQKKDAAGVRRTVQNCSVILDELTKELDELARNPYKRPAYLKTMQFVADTYAGLDRHEDAARLYQKYPEPGPEAPAREVQNYWYLQVMSARQLRLGRDFAAARKVLDRVAAHPQGRKQILAEKEQVHLLEDQRQYAQAANRWGKFMNQPAVAGQVADNEPMRKLYFDCYYHFAFCYYQAGLQQKSAAKKRDYVRKAAGYVVALESHQNQSGWLLVGPRFRDLLEAEAPLREQYEALKKERGGKAR
jgi:hypothetical protein